VFPHGSIQAGHVDVVMEIMEFYYRKRGRRLQVWSLPGVLDILCAGKRSEEGEF
jgi:hypothetical protein